MEALPKTLGLFLFPTLSALVLTGNCLVLQNRLVGSQFSLSSFLYTLYISSVSAITINLYRNKKNKINLVAFSSIVNLMEVNTENKVLKRKKKCLNVRFCLWWKKFLMWAGISLMEGGICPLSTRAILVFCLYRQWRKRRQKLTQSNRESQSIMTWLGTKDAWL